jgi:hypothetical protein
LGGAERNRENAHDRRQRADCACQFDLIGDGHAVCADGAIKCQRGALWRIPIGFEKPTRRHIRSAGGIDDEQRPAPGEMVQESGGLRAQFKNLQPLHRPFAKRIGDERSEGVIAHERIPAGGDEDGGNPRHAWIYSQ